MAEPKLIIEDDGQPIVELGWLPGYGWVSPCCICGHPYPWPESCTRHILETPPEGFEEWEQAQAR